MPHFALAATPIACNSTPDNTAPCDAAAPQAFVDVIDLVRSDLYLHRHSRYYMREVRLKAYTQVLGLVGLGGVWLRSMPALLLRMTAAGPGTSLVLLSRAGRPEQPHCRST